MGQALYYVTMGTCIFGGIIRIFLSGYYRILLKSLKNMKTTKNKWLARLKEQFILRYQAMLGVQNVESFVERFLAERRMFGLPVAFWSGLHIQLVSFCLLFGAITALYLCIEGMETVVILKAMFQGLWTSALLLVLDGFCMVPAKAEALRFSLCDYLENYLQVQLEHEYSVWGKDREEFRQTRAVAEAQLQVIDLKAYKKQKREQKKLDKLIRKQQKKSMAKRKPEIEKKVRKDVLLLKQEVEARRKRDAETAAAMELERNTSHQVEEILRGIV